MSKHTDSIFHKNQNFISTSDYYYPWKHVILWDKILCVILRISSRDLNILGRHILNKNLLSLKNSLHADFHSWLKWKVMSHP